MYAVSAIHTNKRTAKLIEQRKAQVIEMERRERYEKLARLDELKAEEEQRRKEREEAERVAHEQYLKIISAFREVEVGLSPERIPVKSIVKTAIRGTPYTYEDIISPRRFHRLSDFRHYAILCVWAARPDLSLPNIGKNMGGRDHTTIIHARDRFGFESREEAAEFIRKNGRDATMARLQKRAA